MQKIMSNEGGLDEIYNPTIKCTPKTKQIFKIEKFPRSTSSCSSNYQSKNRMIDDQSAGILSGASLEDNNGYAQFDEMIEHNQKKMNTFVG